MTIAQLRDAYSTAAAALHEAADAFQAADPDTSEEDLAALQERFDAAETAADEARVALEAQERVEAARARTPVPVVPDTDPGDGDEPSPSEVRVTSEEPVYRRDRPERSFFQDAYAARVMGDQDAAERLRRNTAQVAERYDLNSTDGTGGYFVPPAWLQDEFLVLARASRPFANAVRRTNSRSSAANSTISSRQWSVSTNRSETPSMMSQESNSAAQRLASSAENRFGSAVTEAMNWASVIPEAHSSNARSWLRLICFAIWRCNPCEMPSARSILMP